MLRNRYLTRSVPRQAMLVAGLLLGVTSAAHAEIITFDFTAVAGAESHGLGVSGGELLSGSYSFDSTVSNSAGAASAGIYNNSIVTFSLAGYSAPGVTTSFISIFPTFYAAQAYSEIGANPSLTQGTLIAFALSLPTSEFRSISNFALPLTPPDPSLFSAAFEQVSYNITDLSTSKEVGLIYGTVTSLTLVPEPPAPALLLGACLGLIVSLRKRRSGPGWRP